MLDLSRNAISEIPRVIGKGDCFYSCAVLPNCSCAFKIFVWYIKISSLYSPESWENFKHLIYIDTSRGIQASGFTEVILDEISMQEKSLWKYCVDSKNNIAGLFIPPIREQVEGKKEN